MKKIYALLFAVVFFMTANNSFSDIVDVTATTGTTSAGYTSLDLALAQVGVLHTGIVTVKITASHTSGSGTINNSNFTSCTIYPTAAVTVTYAGAASCILLSGADNVTIDGRLNGVENVGNTNSLSINCTATTSGVRGIQTQNGSQNIMIRNVNITVPTVVTAISGGRCINIAQSTSAAQGGQDNNTIKYCNLSGGDRVLQTFGSAGIAFNDNTVIFGNKVRNASSLAIFVGSDVTNPTVDSNEIYDDVAVYKGGAAGTSSRSIGQQAIGNVVIKNNLIHDISDNGVRTAGISIQGIINIPFRSVAPLVTPATTVTIQNNFIRLGQNNVKASSTYGLFVTMLASPSGMPYDAKVYNNTALIGGTGGGFQEFTYGLIFDVSDAGIGTTTATYYNNVALNVRAATANSQHVGLDFEVEPGVANTSDYNTAYTDGSPTTGVYFDFTDAAFGYNSSFGWKAANCPSYEQHSANHPVNYDVNYQITNQNYGDLNGKPLAGVTKDIFGNNRPAVYPYRGAVEGPALKVLTVTAGLEGRTGPENSDMLVALYNGCTFVDYASGYITDSDNQPKYIFSTAVANGTAYTLQCLTATHLESWSSGTSTFTAGNASYVFNSASSIYDGNGTSTGQFYSGDVNQDGAIDASDLSETENTIDLAGCRVSTDVNYDEYVDGSDLANVENNAGTGYYTAAPCSADNVAANTVLARAKKQDRVRLTTDRKSVNSVVSGF